MIPTNMLNSFAKKLSFAAAVALTGSLMCADTVSGTGAGSNQVWQSWSASQANGSGSAYWNNVSWDGANKNIGNCLTSSSCGLTSVPGALPYLGQANGHAYSDFYFSGSSTPVTATLEGELAGDSPYDYLGWYNVQNPNQYGFIFSPGNSIGSTVAFTPTAEYGLFFVNQAPGIGDVFTSQSSLSPSDAGYQHFAVFQGSANSYYVGAEDLPSSNTDFDYNDMVVKMSTASAAPEPSALLLFAVGITALGAFRYRRAGKSSRA